MDFRITEEQERLRQRCLEMTAEFATRSAEHDRDASHPTENYDRLRHEGFLALTVPRSLGGLGFDFLSHTLAYEALGQGCPATALAFNMHASVVMPLMQSPEFLVGEAVSSITRTALTLGGAHGIFKGSRLEQLFRDGALAEIQPPPKDFCLWNMGIHELGLDPADLMPPLQRL